MQQRAQHVRGIKTVPLANRGSQWWKTTRTRVPHLKDNKPNELSLPLAKSHPDSSLGIRESLPWSD